MSARRYPIRIGRRSAPFLRLAFGVTPDRAWAAIEDGTVIGRFGRFEVRLPVSSITRWRIEGPWRWITAIGVRRSVRHADVSFARNPPGRVPHDLATPERWKIFDLPAIYLGVEELEAFAAELAALGIPGEDARTSR